MGSLVLLRFQGTGHFIFILWDLAPEMKATFYGNIAKTSINIPSVSVMRLFVVNTLKFTVSKIVNIIQSRYSKLPKAVE